MEDDQPSSVSFVIRPARAQDKEAVLAFCQHTFDWGDYLPLVWDEWLADVQGRLLVATCSGAPVGIAKVSLLTPTEAWLQGLRVHEAYRRHGLAGLFLQHCLHTARQLGARVARLATSSHNTAVHKTTERAGMRRVAAFQVLQTKAGNADGTSLAPAQLTLKDWPQVSARIQQGTTLAQTSGLYGVGWAWQELTPDKLRAHLEKGQVLAWREDGRLAATAVIAGVDEDDKCLLIGYADGDRSQMRILAYALRHFATAQHLESVEFMAPSGAPSYQAFFEAGYQPESETKAEVWIYELRLEGATS